MKKVPVVLFAVAVLAGCVSELGRVFEKGGGVSRRTLS